MSTPNNDSPTTQPWAEALAKELVSYNYHAEALKKGGTYEKELNAHLAIILKFAQPDLSAEVARLREELNKRDEADEAFGQKWGDLQHDMAVLRERCEGFSQAWGVHVKRIEELELRKAQLEAALPGAVNLLELAKESLIADRKDEDDRRSSSGSAGIEWPADTSYDAALSTLRALLSGKEGETK